MTDLFKNAACRGKWGLFHPENYRDSSANIAWAKQLCAECPVSADCLAYAIEHQEWLGIWGGLTPNERKVIARGRGMAVLRRKEIEHGSDAGYAAHRANNSTACDACREAHNAAANERKNAQRTPNGEPKRAVPKAHRAHRELELAR